MEAPERRRRRRKRPRQPLGRRGLLWIVRLRPSLLIVALIARHFDEYLRRTLEAKVNQRLHGYTVSLGHAHLSPFGLSLTLERAVIRQQANPDPPVADIPRLTTSVEWREILGGIWWPTRSSTDRASTSTCRSSARRTATRSRSRTAAGSRPWNRSTRSSST